MDGEQRERLLYDYFAGNLAEQEMAEVEKWVQASEENAKEFECFRRSFLEMRWGMRVELVKGTREGLERRLRQSQRRRLVRRMCTWAAVVTCSIGLGLVLRFQQNGNVTDSAEVAVIKSGKSQARLVLSSGETVMLDGKGMMRMLTEANGMEIEVDSNGMVKYTEGGAEQTDVLYNTVVTPRGGEFSVVLADGTRVWLNSETELKYPVAFAGDTREVTLKGEAYFEVTKDKERPFVVKAGEIDVRVYGTGFNVNNYDNDVVETVLVQGSVGISKNGEMNKEVRLTPGQKGTAERGCGFRVEEVDTHVYTAWKDGNFVFENESLEKIMETLTRWYDVEVFYARESARQERLSGDMKRYQDIQSLLYYFEQISDVRFEMKEKTIIIN